MAENKRMKTYFGARVVFCVILLVFLLLAWYGAEMLLYGYSQPSIVKIVVAIWLVLSISGRLQKEMIANDIKRNITNGVFRKLAEKKEESDGEN